MPTACILIGTRGERSRLLQSGIHQNPLCGGARKYSEILGPRTPFEIHQYRMVLVRRLPDSSPFRSEVDAVDPELRPVVFACQAKDVFTGASPDAFADEVRSHP